MNFTNLDAISSDEWAELEKISPKEWVVAAHGVTVYWMLVSGLTSGTIGAAVAWAATYSYFH